MTSPERESPYLQSTAVERLRLAEEPGRPPIDYLLGIGLWAITAGGTTSVAILFMSNKVAANDTLSFIGAMVGAGATVAGAARLANSKERRERRQEQETVLTAINDLRRKLGGLIPFLSTADDDPKRRQIAKNFIQAFMYAEAAETREYFGEVIQHAKTLNFYQRQSVKGLRQALDEYVEAASNLGHCKLKEQAGLLQLVSDRADKAGQAFASRRLTPITSH